MAGWKDGQERNGREGKFSLKDWIVIAPYSNTELFQAQIKGYNRHTFPEPKDSSVAFFSLNSMFCQSSTT